MCDQRIAGREMIRAAGLRPRIMAGKPARWSSSDRVRRLVANRIITAGGALEVLSDSSVSSGLPLLPSKCPSLCPQ